MENNFDFEQSMSVPYPIGSDIKNGQNSLMFLPQVSKVPQAPKVEPVKKKIVPKFVERDSNTYSFCDRKGLKSDRLSSVYDKT